MGHWYQTPHRAEWRLAAWLFPYQQRLAAAHNRLQSDRVRRELYSGPPQPRRRRDHRRIVLCPRPVDHECLSFLIARIKSFENVSLPSRGDASVPEGFVGPSRLLLACAYWSSCRRTHLLSSMLDGAHDVLIACAAADVAFETLANLCFGRIGIVLEQLVRGHNHARGAEATLQAMLFPESLLDRVQAAFRGQSFDCGHLAAVRLHGQHCTGLHRIAIEEYGTGATLRSVAADVGSGEVQRIAQIVDQQHARLYLRMVLLPIHCHGDCAFVRH